VLQDMWRRVGAHPAPCLDLKIVREGTRSAGYLQQKNTDSWRTRMGDLQCAFPLDVMRVPSSVITVATDGECLTCDGFSLGETVHLETSSSSQTTSVA
jgi:hypothetical protein